MKIRALAPWFGGQRGRSALICSALGKHRAFWEPFVGGGSIILAKDRAPAETINDLHGDVINLARVLQDESSAVVLYGRVARMLMAEAFFDEAVERLSRPIFEPERVDVNRAEAFLVSSWMGRNGCAGAATRGNTYCVRFTDTGGAPGVRWQSVIDSMPDWHRRLRGVVILNRDAFELLPRIDDADHVAIYCDPPWFDGGHNYVHSFTAEQHLQLAAELHRFQNARVVLSYDAHPAVWAMYGMDRWAIKTITRPASLKNQGKRDEAGESRTDLLLVNRPGFWGDDQGGLFG